MSGYSDFDSGERENEMVDRDRVRAERRSGWWRSKRLSFLH